MRLRSLINIFKGRKSSENAEIAAVPELNATESEALLASAKQLSQANDPHRALPLLDKAINLDPSNAMAYVVRSEVRRKLGDNRGADRDFEMAGIHLDRMNRGFAALDAGQAAYDADDDKAAIRHFNEAASLLPTLMDIPFRRGLAKRAIEDFEGAIKDFDKVIAIGSSHKAEAFYQRGLIKGHSFRDGPGALWDFSNAIAIDPTDSRYFVSRAIFQEDDFNGLRDLEQALKIDPSNASALLSRSLKHMRLNNYIEATEDLTQLIQMNSPDANMSLADAYAFRATMHVLLYNYDTAIEDYNTAIVLEPGNTRALIERAELKSRLQDFDGAVRDFSRVIEIDPHNAEAYHLRGVVKGSVGGRDNGDSDRTRAIELGYVEN